MFHITNLSEGIVYVFDRDRSFAQRCNFGRVDLQPLNDPEEIRKIYDKVQEHAEYTGSALAQSLLDNWENSIPQFIRVLVVMR
ncbi:MAG: hypothetical protein ACO37W_00275 [Prochlorotrichaceae cyanobacterium]